MSNQTKTNPNTALFETMPVPRAVCTMAVPTIIGQLIVLFYNMADTFFVGRTNNPYMVAGASLILPVFNISLSLAVYRYYETKVQPAELTAAKGE